MDEREILSEKLDVQFGKWRRINTRIDRILLSILLLLMVFAGSGLIDEFAFLGEGIGGVRYHSFTQLLAVNPDTVAWLTMEGTHIDHPVVRSTDNFDYLDKAFDGSFYAGGTLFLDKDNRSFEDSYCIIHGHHMAAGAMFGDLPDYLDKDFFERNSTGVLLTPEYDYDIRVIASGVFDAYDTKIYKTGSIPQMDYVKENALNLCDEEDSGHILVLSTCMDDMTDNRAVVFCSLENRRLHR